MSSDIAIKVENLSKCYQIYDKPRDRLLQMLAWGRKQFYREFWALKDVSFEVKKGETVGIIGRNGSGKSTLLQMICGTLNPTNGSIQTDGRIAALLELGSGFNPEFTGRENVYFNGALLGLTKEEVDARFNDITAFADIGDFIEQPVKTYSSGMMVRLAFAVAINAQPHILIVDEALSVGDELFQRKCFSRIETIRASGATILFVSHAAGQIVQLCDRAIIIDAGEKLAVGFPKQIVASYQKLLYAPIDKQATIKAQVRDCDESRFAGKVQVVGQDSIGQSSRGNFRLQESFDPNLKPSSTIEYESHGAIIFEPTLKTLAGDVVNNLMHGEIYCYTYRVSFHRTVSNVRFGMLIKTTSGIELGGSVSARSIQESLPCVIAGSGYQVAFRFCCALNEGAYFLNAGVVGETVGGETYLHRLIDAAMFRVLPDAENQSTGVVDFSCEPSFEELKQN